MNILNAFSVSMLPPCGGVVTFTHISAAGAASFIDGEAVKSFVGHQDTANIFTEILGQAISVNRDKFTFGTGSERLALIGQYIGPRLPEGATTLPDGATIKWYLAAYQP